MHSNTLAAFFYSKSKESLEQFPKMDIFTLEQLPSGKKVHSIKPLKAGIVLRFELPYPERPISSWSVPFSRNFWRGFPCIKFLFSCKKRPRSIE